MGNRFSALALDDLIKECTGDTDEINKELASYDGSEVVPAGDPSIRNMLDQQSGMSVDYSRVYSQLQRLIENGNNAIELINSMDPSCLSLQTVTATTSLMNAIKNCMAEFTKIHAMHIKYQQTLQLQQLRQNNRQRLMQMKYDMKNKGKSGDQEGQTLTVFDDKTTNQIYQYIQRKRAQQKDK